MALVGIVERITAIFVESLIEQFCFHFIETFLSLYDYSPVLVSFWKKTCAVRVRLGRAASFVVVKVIFFDCWWPFRQAEAAGENVHSGLFRDN